MSWLYSRALVEAYSAANSLDGALSAQSSGNLTPQAYCAPDKMTAFSRLSRYGMTCKPLTADLGRDVLTWFQAGFHAKTYQPPEKGPASTANAPACGDTWPASLATWDPDLCLWKTRQCLLFEDSTECLETLPSWGMMRNGALWEQTMSEPTTSENGSGLWPTTLPTPLSSDHKKVTRNKEYHLRRNYDLPNKLVQLGHPASKTDGWGWFHPNLSEWMMGWPLGWTDLKPLAMDKFRMWQRMRGNFLMEDYHNGNA